MNIDFAAAPGFSTYVVLLIVSGVAMLLMAALAHTSGGLRLLNAVVGLAFFGYGLYLGFMFDGGGYLIFFKAFILPAVLVFRSIKSMVAGPRQVHTSTAAPAQPVEPGRP